VTLDILNPFVYCSKNRHNIGEASSASQQPNSRQSDMIVMFCIKKRDSMTGKT